MESKGLVTLGAEELKRWGTEVEILHITENTKGEFNFSPKPNKEESLG